MRHDSYHDKGNRQGKSKDICKRFKGANPKLGFGCVLGNSWTWGKWDYELVTAAKLSIEYLELFALTAGVLTWEYELKNMRLLVHCDNMSVVEMINSNSSTCSMCMFLLRLLTLNGLKFNRKLTMVHIRSHLNILSDALSRSQWDRFSHEAPATMCPYPD